MTRPLHAVVETPEFAARARRLMSDERLAELVDHIAARPDAGALIPGTGGARKVRWAVGGRGKSGGLRVISYCAGADVPVFLLSVFGKSEKADLTGAERNELRVVLAELVDVYREGVRRHVEGRRKHSPRR